MESVLDALGHPVRRRAVEVLLQHGPARQEVLRSRLEAQGGTLSKHMRPLLASGLVARPTPRGECQLTNPVDTLRLLKAAAELDEAIALQRAAEASDASQRLDDIDGHRET